jgi:hypothetical protein
MHVNLQHSRSATYNLIKTIDTEEPDIILIQEPYEYRNRPIGIEKKHRIFTAGQGKHTAVTIIIINSKIDAMLIAKLSNADRVVLEMEHKNLQFLAASMYCDTEEPIENDLKKKDETLQFASGGRILMTADSNARSKTWHDVETNPRGRKMEEFLASSQLHIIDEESGRFTFNNSRGVSNIDLTVTNNNLIGTIGDWEIGEEESQHIGPQLSQI